MAKINWSLDLKHSELGFKIKHLMITSVSGFFKNFEIKAETDGEDFSTAKIHLKADMKSISTNNEQRDQHLLNSDFFSVGEHPEMIFESARIEKLNDEHFNVHGNLTLKSETHPVILHVEYSGITKDPWGGTRAGFTVTGIIKRSQWGVNFNGVLETGGAILGEEVKINSEIQLVKEVLVAA
jgi:polyisoprenoid-binding protein YceI